MPLSPDQLSFLLFPVERPELFDAVLTDTTGAVREIQVKQKGAETRFGTAMRDPTSAATPFAPTKAVLIPS